MNIEITQELLNNGFSHPAPERSETPATENDPLWRAEAEARQRVALDKLFASRKATPATADFDLPAPNEPVAAPELDVEAERRAYIKACPDSVFMANVWTDRQEQEFKVWLAARRVSHAIAAPQGCKLLSREPVEAMVHAAQDLPAPRMFGAVWRAMWDAAPSPHSPVGAKEQDK